MNRGRGIRHELWLYLRVRKKFWLFPVVFLLVLLGLLMVFAQGSVLAPLLYPLM